MLHPLLLLLPAPFLPQDAQPVPAEIVEVTVYGDSALVRRRAELPSGGGRFVIEDLPATIDPENVRVTCTGTVSSIPGPVPAPFTGASIGDPVVLEFEVFDQPFVFTQFLWLYDIDLSVGSLRIGNASLGYSAGAGLVEHAR